jgi:hypothetical protein
MTVFASFCVTFNIDIMVNLLCVTEVVSENPADSHITWTCVRLNENTSGLDLLACFVKSSNDYLNNYLNVVVNENLTTHERVAAREIFDSKPTLVVLAHLFRRPEKQCLRRPGPREHRIEGQLCFTQEQLASAEDMRVNLAVALKDYAFHGATIRMTFGEDLSGTDQRRFFFSASANVFDHPTVGVARTDGNIYASTRAPQSCGSDSPTRASATTSGRSLAEKPPRPKGGWPQQLSRRRARRRWRGG